jgi:hypothetical protein
MHKTQRIYLSHFILFPVMIDALQVSTVPKDLMLVTSNYAMEMQVDQ